VLAQPALSTDSLVRAGRERLHPAISNPNWLVLKSRRRIFQRWLGSLDVKHAKVLDIGGRIQPYRELIPFDHTYWSIDIRQTALVSVLGDAERLPLADDSIDIVICTQMIEYVTSPEQLAQEIRRVLRTGGQVLLSAPSIFPRDSEHDRWRFFPATLRQLFRDFSEIEIVPECGSAAGFLRTVAVMCHSSARYDAVRFALGCTVIPLLNVCSALVEKLRPMKDGSFTVNYSLRAVK
jgi:SAM-dependent methyltransferase